MIYLDLSDLVRAANLQEALESAAPGECRITGSGGAGHVDGIVVMDWNTWNGPGGRTAEPSQVVLISSLDAASLERAWAAKLYTIIEEQAPLGDAVLAILGAAMRRKVQMETGA